MQDSVMTLDELAVGDDTRGTGAHMRTSAVELRRSLTPPRDASS